MIEAILGVITVLAGIIAEAMRRKWVQADKKAVENAHRIAELLAERDRGWRDADPGRVFNSKP
jgi:hypothetical protein